MSELHTTRVVDTETAERLAVYLVMESAWFTCTPLPDDEYEFVVKADRTALLRDDNLRSHLVLR